MRTDLDIDSSSIKHEVLSKSVFIVSHEGLHTQKQALFLYSMSTCTAVSDTLNFKQ